MKKINFILVQQQLETNKIRLELFSSSRGPACPNSCPWDLRLSETSRTALCTFSLAAAVVVVAADSSCYCSPNGEVDDDANE